MESDAVFRSVPVDLLAREDGVIISRGTMQLHVAGAEAGEFVAALLEATAGDGASRAEIMAEIDEPWHEPVTKLIDRLIERRVLVSAEDEPAPSDGEESVLDVFYWNFGLTSAQAVDKMNVRTLVVIGANFLGRRFATTMVENGLTNLVVVDDPALRNARMCDAAGALVGWPDYLGLPLSVETWLEGFEDGDIAAVVCLSDFGHRSELRRWNEICVERNLIYFPVLLDRMHGEVGPLVVPRETACYECLRARENSNMNDPVKERFAEASAALLQRRNTFHGAMVGIVADLAALEMNKMLSGAQMPNFGVFSTMRLLEPAVTSRYVLKVPRCRVCSPMLWRPSPNLDMKSFWEQVMVSHT